MSRREVLRVHRLTTVFDDQEGRTVALDDVSFKLHEGEVLGIVGESGSGKSVTALSILGLLPENAHHPTGHVEVCGKQLASLRPRELSRVRGREVAMIFQEPMTSLNPVMRVGDQIIEVLQQHRGLRGAEALEAAADLLDEVGIPEPRRRLDGWPHELSGGQRQRVMIAMALAGEPRVLIADEPTTALDVTVQARILTLLRATCERRNMALLFVSHDLAVVAELAERVIVMRGGRIVEQGLTAEVFARPSHPYTRGLIACRPSANPGAARLPTVDSVTAAEALSAGSPAPGPVASRSALVAPAGSGLPEPDDDSPLLSVRDLRVRFPTSYDWLARPTAWLDAVNGVSFDLAAGSTLGLVGGSGCGKTTLARAILGLIPVDGGTVMFEGKPTFGPQATDRRQLRRALQVVFQDPASSLNPRQTVEQLLCEPMIVHGIGTCDEDRRARAAALLEEVGLLADHLRRHPHAFSGGQRQRIAIARALSLSPRLILCDEAVSALDVSVQAQILNLLRDLQEQRGLAYLFISHDLSVVRFMADRLAVMEQGRLVETGPAEAIWRAPRHATTRGLIEAVPTLPHAAPPPA